MSESRRQPDRTKASKPGIPGLEPIDREMPARLTPAQPIPDARGKEVVQAAANREAPPPPGQSPSLAAKERQRALTAHILEQVCEPANLNRAYARVAYFRHAACRSHLQWMDKWIRRKLRCLRLKQRKRAGPIAEFLHQLGVPKWRAWIGALSGKGWWRRSGSPPAMEGMTLAWFASLGLVNLVQRYEQLNC